MTHFRRLCQKSGQSAKWHKVAVLWVWGCYTMGTSERGEGYPCGRQHIATAPAMNYYIMRHPLPS